MATLGSYAEGSIVQVKENGAPVDFYVAKHNYEPGLNGNGRTLLVRKDSCNDSIGWGQSSPSTYVPSVVDSWVNATYLRRLDIEVQNAIGTTGFYCAIGGGNSTVTSYARSVFILSVSEFGLADTGEGSALPIASTLLISKYNGSAAHQMTRSVSGSNRYYVNKSGALATSAIVSTMPVRPVFTLPDTITVENGVVVGETVTPSVGSGSSKMFMGAPTVSSSLGSMTEGSIVQINENGTPADFYVAKHDYESDLNGAGRTLLVRKGKYEYQKWHSSNVNAYATSDIDAWLNSDYKALLSPAIQNAIGTTSFPYTVGNGNYTITNLSRSVFLISAYEVNVVSAGYFNSEGSVLPIASEIINSSDAFWTRTCYTRSAADAIYIDRSVPALHGGTTCSSTMGAVPCFTLPSDIGVFDGLITGASAGIKDAAQKAKKMFVSWPTKQDAMKFLDYIESSGTQYIDTGFTPNQNTSANIKFSTTQQAGGGVMVAMQAWRSRGFGIFVNAVIFGSSALDSTGLFGDGLIHEVSLTADAKCYDNGSLIWTGDVSTFTAPETLTICKSNVTSEPHEFASAKIYSCQIYDNGTLVRDYVPCQAADGAIGLYDKANSQFYANAGAGTFTAGSVVEEVGGGIIQAARKAKKAYIGDENGICKRFLGSMELPTFTGSHALFGNEEKGYIEMYDSGTLTLSDNAYDIHLVGGGAKGGAYGTGGGSSAYTGCGGGGSGYTITLFGKPLGGEYTVEVGSGEASSNTQYRLGGGSTRVYQAGSNAIVAQGFGGDASYYFNASGGGSGGGAGASGGYSGQNGGSDGSDGTANSDSAGGVGQHTTTRDFQDQTLTLRAGGGGGSGAESKGGLTGGIGGAGGGGNGASSKGTVKPTGGAANTGGGGGGNVAYGRSYPGAAGGSGIAIIRWGY